MCGERGKLRKEMMQHFGRIACAASSSEMHSSACRSPIFAAGGISEYSSDLISDYGGGGGGGRSWEGEVIDLPDQLDD